MKKVQFTKMHGLGNSYIYINLFEEHLAEESLSRLAIEVSNLQTGIGSDGMILICPSEKAPVMMRIFNSDGSEGKNCGNGLRCVAKYAYEKGLVHEKMFQIETLSGLVTAEVIEENGIVQQIIVDMGAPRLERKEIPMLGDENDKVISESFVVNGETYSLTAVSMGNPHGIIFVDDIEKSPVRTLGPIIEKDLRFPEWINAEFVEVVNDTELHFRVWERGSGETQACGTGACAAAVAAVLNGYAERNKEITVHLAGGDLFITWQDNGHVLMKGPAEYICEGSYFIG